MAGHANGRDAIELPQLPKATVGGYRVEETNRVFLRMAWDLQTLQDEERRLRERVRDLERERASATKELEQLRSELEDVGCAAAELQGAHTQLAAEHAQRTGEAIALREELERLRTRKGTSESALTAAQDAARQLRESARRDAELTLRKARMKAREILGRSEHERKALTSDIERLEALEAATRDKIRRFLESALDGLDPQADGPPELAHQLQEQARKRKSAG